MLFGGLRSLITFSQDFCTLGGLPSWLKNRITSERETRILSNGLASWTSVIVNFLYEILKNTSNRLDKESIWARGNPDITKGADFGVLINVHQTTSATSTARHEHKEARRECNDNSLGKEAIDNARARGLQGERRVQDRRAERGLVEEEQANRKIRW